MSELAGRLQNLPLERQKYLLQAMPGHLFKARQTGRLRRLLCERDWFQIQRAHDPSDRSYATGLELALQACQADPNELPGLVTLSLLSATLNTLAGKVPVAALESMTLDGAAEEAIFLAEQRTDPVERCESLCSLALASADGGQHQRAFDLLERAEKAAQSIPDTAARLEGLLAVAGVAYQIGADREEAVKRLNHVASQVSSLPDERRQTHLQAYIGQIADHLSLPEQKGAAVQAIRSAYQRTCQLTSDARRALNMGAIQAFGEARRATWDISKFTKDYDLFDRPDDLILLAEWDASRTTTILDRPGEMLALLIRAAYRKNDLKRCQALIERALSKQMRNTILYDAGDSPDFIEALGEIGFTDLAVKLIGEYLASDPDAVHLREALARGAGVSGDMATIERAAGPIQTARTKADLGDRLWRAGEGIKHSLKRGGYRALGMGDLERLQVLLSGYETLKQHHPQKARNLWERLGKEGGARWQKLAQEHVGEQAGESTQLRYLDRLGGIARWLPSGASGMEEIQTDAVEGLVFAGNIERALEVANQIPDQKKHGLALETIATGLIERGQIQAALEIGDRIANQVVRQRVLESAAEAAAQLQKGQAQKLVPQITAHSRQLSEDEQLTAAAAFPALMDRYLTSKHLGEALRLIEPLGEAALVNALPALAAAARKQEAFPLADHLLRATGGAPTGQASIQALALTAALWASPLAGSRAGQAGWRERANRVYQIAKKRQKSLPTWESRENLPYLAIGAAALGERSELAYLQKQVLEEYKQAGKILQFEAPPVLDQAMVQIIAGLAHLGASTEKVYEDIQLIQNPYYRAQAWVEVSEALEGLAAGGEYRPRLGEWLGMAGEILGEKLDDMIEGSQEPVSGNKTAWQRQVEGELGFRIKAALNNAARFTPQVAPPGESGARLAGQIGFQASQRIEFKERPSKPENSLVGPIRRMIAVFGRHRHYEELVKVVRATPYRSDLPEVVSAAVSVLVCTGEMQVAKGLLALLPKQVDQAIPKAILAARTNPAAAPKQLRDCLNQPWSAPTLKMLVKTTSQLADKAARGGIAAEILRLGRQRGREELLLGIAALATTDAALLDENVWPTLVEDIVGTESWWT